MATLAATAVVPDFDLVGQVHILDQAAHDPLEGHDRFGVLSDLGLSRGTEFPASALADQAAKEGIGRRVVGSGQNVDVAQMLGRHAFELGLPDPEGETVLAATRGEGCLAGRDVGQDVLRWDDVGMDVHNRSFDTLKIGQTNDTEKFSPNYFKKLEWCPWRFLKPDFKRITSRLYAYP